VGVDCWYCGASVARLFLSLSFLVCFIVLGLQSLFNWVATRKGDRVLFWDVRMNYFLNGRIKWFLVPLLWFYFCSWSSFSQVVEGTHVAYIWQICIFK
jgi:hypothetical protein